MGGRVIQGFFIGGCAPGARASAQFPSAIQPSAPAGGGARPGPPSPAFAGRGVAAQPRLAPAAPAPVHVGGGDTVQRSAGHGSFAIDPRQVGLNRGGGSPLPQAVRAKMEAAFGADFSAVRVHVGPQASRIGALAFTTGNDLYFAPGQYQPGSVKGQQLIGHELAHVIQQRQGRVRAPGSGVAVVQDRALEAEADRLGMRAAAHSVPVQRKALAGAQGILRRLNRPGPPQFANLSRRLIQRMEDEEYIPSDDGGGSGSDSGSDDDEVRIEDADNFAQWQLGVATGYAEGWDRAIVEEAAEANPAMTAAVARGLVGLPGAGAILHAQNNPPDENIIDEPGIANNEGRAYGDGLGHTAGARMAFRVCGWRRGNYPAIPWARRVAALAQNGGNCVYCNAAPSAEVDHVYPIQKHWTTLGYRRPHQIAQVNDADNLVGSCSACNGAKSNTYLNHWVGHGWGAGQWFPSLPVGTIPARRGGPVALGNW